MMNFIEKIKKKLLKYKITIFILLMLEIIIAFAVYINNQREINTFIDNKIKSAQVEYNAVYRKTKEQSKMVFQESINTPKIIKIFKNANTSNEEEQSIIREKLYNNLLVRYEKLQNLVNLRQVHFHLPDNKSFLRMHKPSKYGDDLSGVRTTVEYVSKNKKPIDGFEEGRVYNGFRFVYPLFDDANKYLGSVETSFSMNSFNDTLNNDLHSSRFIIRKSIVQEKVWGDDAKSNYIQSPISSLFLVDKNQIDDKSKETFTHEIASKLKTKFLENILHKNAFSLILPLKEKTNLLTFLPIKNPISGKIVSYLVLISQDKVLNKFHTEFWALQVLSLILVLSIFTFLYRHQENQDLLRKSESKYTSIIDHIKEHYFFYSHNKEGMFINLSDSVVNILGYSKQEFMQHYATYLTNDPMNALVEEKTNKTINGDPQKAYVISIYHKDGTIRYLEVSDTRINDSDGNFFSLDGVARDITQKYLIREELKEKNIELTKEKKKLEEQHQYLQSIIDGVDDPIMVIKEDYTIDLMNNTLKKSMQNVEVADPQNPKCYEVSHHRSTPCDGFEHPCPLRDVLESKKHTTVVHNHSTEDEDDKYIELSASPLFDKSGECIGIIESARDITAHLIVQDELREQKNILFHQAHHDALTKLPNRVLFNDRLEQAIEKGKRKGSKFALLFIDLDHFKEINDSLGHAIGDEVLKIVTTRLHETIREKDSVSRLGGDEFTIILEDLNQIHDASLITNKILKVLSQAMNVNENVLYVSSSIGISIFPDDGVSTQNLLKYADSAMYKAKDEGRNNYQYYDSTMTQLAIQRVVMETSLRDAITNEEFVVHYQPQVNANTNKLIGMEALVRWQHPTMGLISPDKFISLAETTGLIVKLDRLTMKIAMSQVAQWYQDGLNPGILSMNLAVKQLKEKDFIKVLENLMKNTACKAEWIELEVTESQVMTNPDEAIKLLTKINNLGIKLSVDDFGTGYSSLSYLKRLPIEKLKIDQAFVKDLPHDEDDASITRAVVALAKSLNLNVIAEGVETKEQKDFLLANGCENIQGYFYSKAILAQELEVILRKGSSKITL